MKLDNVLQTYRYPDTERSEKHLNYIAHFPKIIILNYVKDITTFSRHKINDLPLQLLMTCIFPAFAVNVYLNVLSFPWYNLNCHLPSETSVSL